MSEEAKKEISRTELYEKPALTLDVHELEVSDCMAVYRRNNKVYVVPV